MRSITVARRRAHVVKVFSMRVWGHRADPVRLTRLIRGPLGGRGATWRARCHPVLMNYITRTWDCAHSLSSLSNADIRCPRAEIDRPSGGWLSVCLVTGASICDKRLSLSSARLCVYLWGRRVAGLVSRRRSRDHQSALLSSRLSRASDLCLAEVACLLGLLVPSVGPLVRLAEAGWKLSARS